jgi:hypothetical protein
LLWNGCSKKKNELIANTEQNCFVEGGVVEPSRTIDRTSNDISRQTLTDKEEKWLKETVLPIISNMTVRIGYNRKNSGIGRSQVFGYGDRRQRGYGDFLNNKRHPELWKALALFGEMVVPKSIPWTAIQVNHNYQTKEHIDGNNIGKSLSVSFGDFEGGELVIADVPYQTKYHPVIFNGALARHRNEPIQGNRYSLVYFVSAPPKMSDDDIYKLNERLISDIKD